MSIIGSLRFRIIAGYVISTLITTACYTVGGLTVLRISDDELFNWYLARVAAARRQEVVEGLISPETAASGQDVALVGRDADVIRALGVVGESELPESLLSWPAVRHVSKAPTGLLEIHEAKISDRYFHIVKMPAGHGFSAAESFYYAVDVSGYDKLKVSAAHGTYFGLSVLLLLFIIISVFIGVFISRRVITPLTRLAHDVERAGLGSKLSGYYPDEVGTLAIKIDQLMTRIGHFVEREKAFSRDVSHELRTPVTSSQIAVELAQQLTKGGDSRLADILDRITAANQDMVHLIETFLEMGREQTSTAANCVCDLSAVVAESISRNLYLSHGRDVSVQNLVREGIEVFQPKRLLAVAVDNLVRNALQYTDSGRITIEGSAHSLSVSDTGRGFDPAALDRLMQPYETFHGEGLGLGLNIVRRICELAGWQFSAQSQCGVGSSMSICFEPSRAD